jgi:hypothetical protein
LDKERKIKIVKKDDHVDIYERYRLGSFYLEEDGFYHFNSDLNCLDSWRLRKIADELDKLNSEVKIL